MTNAPSSRPRAVILLSGGLDSTTVLAIAREQGFEPYALSFHYGQRHIQELVAAESVARSQGVVKHVVAQIDLRVWWIGAYGRYRRAQGPDCR